MAKGKLRKLAVIGAAIGGVVFFWRKRKAQGEAADAGDSAPGPAETAETAETADTTTE
jgi:hypothetical protein